MNEPAIDESPRSNAAPATGGGEEDVVENFLSLADEGVRKLGIDEDSRRNSSPADGIGENDLVESIILPADEQISTELGIDESSQPDAAPAPVGSEKDLAKGCLSPADERMKNMKGVPKTDNGVYLVEVAAEDAGTPWVRHLVVPALIGFGIAITIQIILPSSYPETWPPYVKRLDIMSNLIWWVLCFTSWCEKTSPISVNAEGKKLFFRCYTNTPMRKLGVVFILAVVVWLVLGALGWELDMRVLLPAWLKVA